MLFLYLVGGSLFAQSSPNHPGAATVTLDSDTLDTETQLQQRYIDPATFTAITASGDTLQPGSDYTLDATKGLITWLRPPEQTLTLRFRHLPIRVPDKLYRRSLKDARAADSLVAGEDAVLLPRAATGDNAGMFAEANLRRSGHIFRGVQVGSTSDPSLESGLRLQLGGRVTRDIEVKALLDDRNLPIQPEGTSRRLEEIDQVYVDIRSRRAHGRFGDYTLDYEGGRYGTFDRRLEGAQAEYLGPDIQVSASGAATKAQFHTNRFQGSFGVQGPYRLRGKNGEAPILVVGGSEKVYVDGELRTRGEQDDYIIDYSRGEITFMPRLPISSESRIEVQFEYSSDMYPRNLYSGRVEAATPNRKFRAVATAISEGDDKYNPISFDMTPATKRAIADHQDSGGPAAIPAADSLGPGEGDYVRRDTTWTDGDSYTFYQWSPPDNQGRPTGSWSVLFSEVGPGNGSYTRQYDAILGAFWFQWVGPDSGDYAPVRLVPLPVQHQLATLSLAAEPVDFVSIQSDVAASAYDPNTLHSKENSLNKGAHETTLNLHTRQVDGMRKLEAAFSYRSEASGFRPFGEDEEVDFNRKWGVVDSTISRSALSHTSIRLTARPLKNATVETKLERLDQGLFYSDRAGGRASYTGNIITSRVSYEYIKSGTTTHISSNTSDSDWRRADGMLSVKLGIWQPSVDGEWEHREQLYSSPGGLTGSDDYRYLRYRPMLTLLGWKGHSGHTAYQRRARDYEVGSSAGAGEYEEDTWEAAWSWLPIGLPFRSDVELVHREKRYTSADSADVTSDLAQLNAFYSPLGGALTVDLQYRLNQTVAQPAALVAYQVPAGQGEYIRVGEGDNVQYIYDPEIGDYILRSEPTGDALPTTDLTTRALIDWAPHRLPEGKGDIEGFGWEDISTSTELEIREVTRWDNPEEIYLFQLGAFQTDSTVSGRLLLRQDIHLWRMSRDFSARVRYEAEKRLTNLYLTGAERNGNDAWELRLRNAVTMDMDLETQGRYARQYKQLAYRSRTDRFRLRRVQSKATWRVTRAWTLSLQGRGLWDSRLEDPDDVLGVGVRPGVVWSIRNRGRVSADFEALWVETPLASVPYELADSRPKGRNGRGNLLAEVQLGEHLTGRAVYTVRLDDGREPLHVARMEVSAFF